MPDVCTEKYTRGVSAVESILTLDRLRQSVAVKELLQAQGQPLMRKTASVPNFSQVLLPLRRLGRTVCFRLICFSFLISVFSCSWYPLLCSSFQILQIFSNSNIFHISEFSRFSIIFALYFVSVVVFYPVIFSKWSRFVQNHLAMQTNTCCKTRRKFF